MQSKLSCGRERGQEAKDCGAAEVCFGVGSGSWVQPLASPKSSVVISWGLIAAGRRCRGLGLAAVLVQHPQELQGGEWGAGNPGSSSLPLFP